MLVTIWFSMRKKNESGKDYFLSGRDANWLQFGSSIFSSNIGSEHFVGLAGGLVCYRHGDGALGNAWLIGYSCLGVGFSCRFMTA